MLVTLKAGAEVNMATSDELEGVADRILGAMPKDDPRPIYLSRSDTDIADGTNVPIIDLGGPPVGSIWQLRCITTFGNDDNTVIGGTTCALYCGDPTSPSLAQLKLTGLTIPSATFIPDTCIWCHPNEHVFIRLSAAPGAGQQVGGIITVEEWRQRDVSRLGGKP